VIEAEKIAARSILTQLVGAGTMGKSNSRGRRDQKKEKKQNKNEPISSLDDIPDIEFLDGSEQDSGATYAQAESDQTPFFGIVDRVELEYFKQAESTLAANAFASNEEKIGFIGGVLDEAKGKELKLVTNQICSKLVERLILLADDTQLLGIFKAFDGNFLNLSKHKYSSHCVETLLVRCAALVEREMVSSNPMELYQKDGKVPEDYVSMENMIIFMVNEMKTHVKDIMTQPYASHVLRILILVLSGSKLPSTTTKSSLRSKKSKTTRKIISIQDNNDFEQAYQVPTVFKEALYEFAGALTKDLDTTSARELSIGKLSSPVIQLVIKLETSDKNVMAASGFCKLLFNMSPKAPKDNSEEAYIEYLLSDPVGLYFFESVVESVPVAVIQRLYTLYMKERMSKLVKRDGANYLIPALLNKLRHTEVKEIIDAVIPELELLINSNNLGIIRAVLDVSKSHKYKQNELLEAFLSRYNGSDDKASILEKVVKLEGSTVVGPPSKDNDLVSNQEMQRALFAESLIGFSPTLLACFAEGFIQLPIETLVEVARHSVFSHVLQSCLVPELDIVLRRRILNNFSGLIVEFACNAYGSHLVDSLWRFAYRLKFFRERIAEELVKETDKVKNSTYGRIVWKNWNLEKYVRKRFEWWALVKTEEDSIGQTLGDSREAIQQKQGTKPVSEPNDSKLQGRGKKPALIVNKTRPHNTKPYDRPTKRVQK
jgi:nucleolar protein 9